MRPAALVAAVMAYMVNPCEKTAIAVAREQYAAGEIDVARLEVKVGLALERVA